MARVVTDKARKTTQCDLINDGLGVSGGDTPSDSVVSDPGIFRFSIVASGLQTGFYATSLFCRVYRRGDLFQIVAHIIIRLTLMYASNLNAAKGCQDEVSKVYMLSTADNAISPMSRSDFTRLSTSVEHDTFKVHTLVNSPDEADIILFVGSTYFDHRDVRAHPIVTSHRQKCFLFHSHDFVIPFLPGIYVNITKRWYSERRTRTGFYLRVSDSDYIPYVPSLKDCEFLFCFVGSTRTHPVRTRIMSLDHPRSYLKDTSAAVGSDEKKQTFFMVNYGSNDNSDYGKVLMRSKFVICPRGYAPSSWRLFETMKAGRVPVIVADQWVPPVGPEWESFTIRVRQKDVAQIPEMLEQHESEAERMGNLARKNWENWFSRETCFHRIVEWCLDLKNNGEQQAFEVVMTQLQMLRPFFVRHVLLPDIKKGVLNVLGGVR